MFNSAFYRLDAKELFKNNEIKLKLQDLSKIIWIIVLHTLLSEVVIVKKSKNTTQAVLHFFYLTILVANF